MATTAFKGTPVHTNGELPATGETAPDFELVGVDLGSKTLEDFAGKKKVLTINPSYDTSVCQATARAFNEKASRLGDVAVLMISADLPFAQKRFCGAEGLEEVVPLSTFRSDFLRDYGVELVDGPLKGLSARAIVVLDENNEVLHTELVPDITQEPDYDAALAAVK
ncbi:MAG TPA: thiol peroxidase [Polyangiales bacterium]|jgi:thiol peroxidase|nr:thiol peroxidase [Polyangiales bacterium]